MSTNFEKRERKISFSDRRLVVKSALWAAPVVTAVSLPSHAQTSPNEGGGTNGPDPEPPTPLTCPGGTMSSAQIPLMGTPWTSLPLTVNQYDPSPGILASINVNWSALVESNLALENLNMTDSTIDVDYGSNLELLDPLNNVVATTSLTITKSYTLQANDGTDDFGGTSGVTEPTSILNDSGSFTITDPTLLAEFIGTGTKSFTGSATAESDVSAGNILTRITTSASLAIEVEYVCIVAIP